ncbi:MAG: hypothetical protein K0U79_15105 [Gammaproteobacteria bacterium]|nr:hypothetical protein [Gammaproteobacteria bacterium]
MATQEFNPQTCGTDALKFPGPLSDLNFSYGGGIPVLSALKEGDALIESAINILRLNRNLSDQNSEVLGVIFLLEAAASVFLSVQHGIEKYESATDDAVNGGAK